MTNLKAYRATDQEKARTDDLLRLLPSGRHSVLDIGARDGHFSRLLTGYFSEVTALDLEQPQFDIPGVRGVAGDARSLDFEDGEFDCVFCAEVLEHIPDVEVACREIVRVARHEIIIGVPYLQDIRIGRTTCAACGHINPPWGHINSFSRESLVALFPGTRVESVSFVGVDNEATNPLSTLLMDWAGNPWGTYTQDEPCLGCGRKLLAPTARTLWQRGCSAVATRITAIQSRRTEAHGNWIHAVFSKVRKSTLTSEDPVL